MCGIVGAAARRDVVGTLIDGLKALEYRGYDSAGLTLAHPGLIVRKVVGRAMDLSNALHADERGGHTGIAHTRWATHGKPEARNAHPHVSGGIAVVHNGIIENHAALRAGLVALGHVFLSDTDSEVVPHLIDEARRGGAAPLDAVRIACAQLHGAYAIAVLFADAPDRILVARQGSPVMVGVGAGVGAVASDPLALTGICGRFAALDDGDIAEITGAGVVILEHFL